MSEAEFTAQVIGFARLHGWRSAHFRPALTRSGRWTTAVQGDGKGFPDLVLVRGRPPELLFAELKVGRNKPTEEQAVWLAQLAATGVAAYLWCPEDWTEIEAVLSRAS